MLFSSPGTVTVFPNPARDEIRIVSAATIESIEVADMTGRVVKKMVVNPDNRYNINDLQKGIYFIKVKDSEKMTTVKLKVE